MQLNNLFSIREITFSCSSMRTKRQKYFTIFHEILIFVKKLKFCIISDHMISINKSLK
jgi:hypothetical protein